MEEQSYSDKLQTIGVIFDVDAIDAELGYPEDHEYYEE